MSVSRKIRLDIRQRLLDTGLFAEVRVTGSPEEYGIAASSASAAFMSIPKRRKKPRWDGGDQTSMTIDERVVVTLMARDADPDVRDDLAENLAEALERSVDGRSLAGLTVPDNTYVETSDPLPPKAPERRIQAVVTTQYIVEGWGNAPDGD